MNIKIGDKIRIKTEEELLADGWQKMDEYYYIKETEVAFVRLCGEIGRITRYNRYGGLMVKLDDLPERQISKQLIAEVFPQTLHEYICSLSLEEMAKYFIKEYVGFEQWHWYSTITQAFYYTQEDALQDTIKALKSPKED